ncbi:MAG: hypothetical protein LBS91_09130 [Clostridiales Family XIII bacterium]|nr:hypothetical protein [Clostridiales Family XIII bacterium]
MKKILMVGLALALVFALAACGGGGGGDTDAPIAPPAGASDAPAETGSAPEGPAQDTAPAPAESAAGGQAMDSLIGWMAGGTFSYDFELTSEGGGQMVTATGSMAADGGNIAVKQSATVEGQQTESRVIIKDGATYVIDDTSKLVIKMANAGAEITSGMMTDYSGITKVGEGTGEVGGKTLPYEEYTAEGASVRYYMDGGQVSAIVSEYEGYKSTMLVSNPKNSVPAGAFDIPEGYTEMSV